MTVEFTSPPARASIWLTSTVADRDPDIVVLLTQGDQPPNPLGRPSVTVPNSPALRVIRDNHMIVAPFGYIGPGPVAAEGLEVLDRELGVLR